MVDGKVTCRNSSTRNIIINNDAIRKHVAGILESDNGRIVYEVYNNNMLKELSVDINLDNEKEFLEWLELILTSYSIIIEYTSSEPVKINWRFPNEYLWEKNVKRNKK